VFERVHDANCQCAATKSSGTLTIRIMNTLEHRNGARPSVRLTIANTGTEIDPEIKKVLFQPFVSTKGNTGCGLGLWVSSGIVQKHGGSIQVKSNAIFPATGSVFSVFLPCKPSFEDALSTIAARLPSSVPLTLSRS